MRTNSAGSDAITNKAGNKRLVFSESTRFNEEGQVDRVQTAFAQAPQAQQTHFSDNTLFAENNRVDRPQTGFIQNFDTGIDNIGQIRFSPSAEVELHEGTLVPRQQTGFNFNYRPDVDDYKRVDFIPEMTQYNEDGKQYRKTGFAQPGAVPQDDENVHFADSTDFNEAGPLPRVQTGYNFGYKNPIGVNFAVGDEDKGDDNKRAYRKTGFNQAYNGASSSSSTRDTQSHGAYIDPRQPSDPRHTHYLPTDARISPNTSKDNLNLNFSAGSCASASSSASKDSAGKKKEKKVMHFSASVGELEDEKQAIQMQKK